jgi:hypothetical protein
MKVAIHIQAVIGPSFMLMLAVTASPAATVATALAAMVIIPCFKTETGILVSFIWIPLFQWFSHARNPRRVLRLPKSA